MSAAADPTTPPLVLTGEGIVLRDWLDADLPHLPGLFDAPDIAANTDIPSPFDSDAFLVRIRRRRAQGIVDLAVTRDGGEPLGLVALHVAIGVLGYAIGPAHRGRGMASRALRLMTSFCHEELGLTRLRLSIVQGNLSSQRVAESAGYVRSDDEVVERTNGLGQPKLLETWHRIAPGTSGWQRPDTTRVIGAAGGGRVWDDASVDYRHDPTRRDLRDGKGDLHTVHLG